VQQLVAQIPGRATLLRSTHVFEVSGGQASHFWEDAPEVDRKPVDDLGAPALAFLTGKDVTARSPNREAQAHG
jgi:hypothetical protein